MAGSGTAHLRPHDEVLLRVENLVVEFPVGRPARSSAVTNISFDVAGGRDARPGRRVGLRQVHHRPGRHAAAAAHARLGACSTAPTSPRSRARSCGAPRPQMQMIFQDPISSLNPRRTVAEIVAEPLNIWKIGTDDERAEQGRRAPDGRRHRSRRPPPNASRTSSPAASASASRIARAVVTEPKLIICDEPVSALDVSVQAQILNLLEDMKERYGLTLVFIAHDLAVVKNICDRVAVMYLGQMCEIGDPDAPLRRTRRTPTPPPCSRSIPMPDPDGGAGHRRPPRRRAAVAASTRRRAAASGPAATGPRSVCAQAEPQMQQVGRGPLRGLPLPARDPGRRTRRALTRPVAWRSGAVRSQRWGRRHQAQLVRRPCPAVPAGSPRALRRRRRSTTVRPRSAAR